VRSSPEEGAPEGVFSVRGAYINGFYDIKDIPYGEKLYGFPETQQTTINLMDVQTVRLWVEGERFTLSEGEVLKYDRELFLDRGGSGGCERYMNGLSRMTSLAARGGVGTEDIIDQMLSVGQCAAYIRRRVKEGDASKGACCPNAIGFALQEMWDDVRESIPNGKNGDSHSAGNGTALALAERVKKEEAITNYAHCPECKQKTLTQEGGCNVCKACGYSRCD
jgi:hypothetical protein